MRISVVIGMFVGMDIEFFVLSWMFVELYNIVNLFWCYFRGDEGNLI